MKPYNHQVIDQAMEMQRTLWICEGEKDTVTMVEAGELAIGAPSSSTLKPFNNVSLEDIPEVVIATDNDDAGRIAADNLKDLFPFAKVVVWPSVYRKGYDVTDLKEDFDKLPGDIPFTEQLRQYIRDDTWEDEADLIGAFLMDARKGTPFIKTGFRVIDNKIKGLLPGGLHVIQGGSSIGKTTFCKQLADQVKVENPDLPIFFFSLEDSLRTVRAMSFSRISHKEGDPVENRCIRMGGDELTEANHKTLRTISPLVKKAFGRNYHVVAGEPDINVLTIRKRVEKKLSRIGKSSAMVIVDYLQILPTPKDARLSSLMERVDFNLHELQCLARDIDGPVILTVSTTKEDIKAGEKGKAPGQVKGKGSANILYTPRMLFELIDMGPAEANKPENIDPFVRTATLHVLKNSEGPKDISFNFTYHAKYSRFVEHLTLGEL